MCKSTRAKSSCDERAEINEVLDAELESFSSTKRKSEKCNARHIQKKFILPTHIYLAAVQEGFQ